MLDGTGASAEPWDVLKRPAWLNQNRRGSELGQSLAAP